MNARARGEITPNAINSAEVQATWFKCEGERIPGGVAFGLYDLEKLYGSDSVVKAIIAASQANTQPRLSFNFVKAVLERQRGGNGYGDTRELDSYVDEVPVPV